MADGFKLSVNGEKVFETNDSVLNISVRGEDGEITRFSVPPELNDLQLEYQTEGYLNRHLYDVDREQRAERRERIQEAEKARKKSDATDTDEDKGKTVFTSGGDENPNQSNE